MGKAQAQENEQDGCVRWTSNDRNVDGVFGNGMCSFYTKLPGFRLRLISRAAW